MKRNQNQWKLHNILLLINLFFENIKWPFYTYTIYLSMLIIKILLCVPVQKCKINIKTSEKMYNLRLINKLIKNNNQKLFKNRYYFFLPTFEIIISLINSIASLAVLIFFKSIIPFINLFLFRIKSNLSKYNTKLFYIFSGFYFSFNDIFEINIDNKLKLIHYLFFYQDNFNKYKDFKSYKIDKNYGNLDKMLKTHTVMLYLAKIIKQKLILTSNIRLKQITKYKDFYLSLPAKTDCTLTILTSPSQLKLRIFSHSKIALQNNILYIQNKISEFFFNKNLKYKNANKVNNRLELDHSNTIIGEKAQNSPSIKIFVTDYIIILLLDKNHNELFFNKITWFNSFLVFNTRKKYKISHFSEIYFFVIKTKLEITKSPIKIPCKNISKKSFLVRMLKICYFSLTTLGNFSLKISNSRLNKLNKGLNVCLFSINLQDSFILSKKLRLKCLYNLISTENFSDLWTAYFYSKNIKSFLVNFSKSYILNSNFPYTYTICEQIMKRKSYDIKNYLSANVMELEIFMNFKNKINKQESNSFIFHRNFKEFKSFLHTKGNINYILDLFKKSDICIIRRLKLNIGGWLCLKKKSMIIYIVAIVDIIAYFIKFISLIFNYKCKVSSISYNIFILEYFKKFTNKLFIKSIHYYLGHRYIMNALNSKINNRPSLRMNFLNLSKVLACTFSLIRSIMRNSLCKFSRIFHYLKENDIMKNYLSLYYPRDFPMDDIILEYSTIVSRLQNKVQSSSNRRLAIKYCIHKDLYFLLYNYSKEIIGNLSYLVVRIKPIINNRQKVVLRDIILIKLSNIFKEISIMHSNFEILPTRDYTKKQLVDDYKKLYKDFKYPEHFNLTKLHWIELQQNTNVTTCTVRKNKTAQAGNIILARLCFLLTIKVIRLEKLKKKEKNITKLIIKKYTIMLFKLSIFYTIHSTSAYLIDYSNLCSRQGRVTNELIFKNYLRVNDKSLNKYYLSSITLKSKIKNKKDYIYSKKSNLTKYCHVNLIFMAIIRSQIYNESDTLLESTPFKHFYSNSHILLNISNNVRNNLFINSFKKQTLPDCFFLITGYKKNIKLKLSLIQNICSTKHRANIIFTNIEEEIDSTIYKNKNSSHIVDNSEWNKIYKQNKITLFYFNQLKYM